MVTFIAGLMVGGLLGVCAMCLLIMSRHEACPMCDGYGMGDEAGHPAEVQHDDQRRRA